jgi:hypothetical protein
MLRAIRIAAVFMLAGCVAAPPPAGHQSTAEADILAVMDAYMLEISANDLAAMDARQTPEGMTYRIRSREDGGWE